MLKIYAILIGLIFFIRNGNRWFHVPVHPRTLICDRHFDTDFILSINLYGYQNVLKHWKLNLNKFKCLYNYGRSLNYIMNVYNLELVQSNEIQKQALPIKMTYFLFTVDLFFITLMIVYLEKLLHCLIIYSYKTNSSFLPCRRKFANNLTYRF